MSGQLYATAALPPRKSSRGPFDRKLGCPQSRSVSGGNAKKKNTFPHLPGIKSQLSIS